MLRHFDNRPQFCIKGFFLLLRPVLDRGENQQDISWSHISAQANSHNGNQCNHPSFLNNNLASRSHGTLRQEPVVRLLVCSEAGIFGRLHATRGFWWTLPVWQMRNNAAKWEEELTADDSRLTLPYSLISFYDSITSHMICKVVVFACNQIKVCKIKTTNISLWKKSS